MSCEVHVRFYERLGVRLPRPTHHVLDLWFQKKWRSHEDQTVSEPGTSAGPGKSLGGA
jgi:hypothetical protein